MSRRPEAPSRARASTICLTVRVSPQEMADVDAFCKRHNVSIQQVLHRCVIAATRGEAAHVVSADDAARGGHPDHPLRRLAERYASE